jgi:hypothetical protein
MRKDQKDLTLASIASLMKIMKAYYANIHQNPNAKPSEKEGAERLELVLDPRHVKVGLVS